MRSNTSLVTAASLTAVFRMARPPCPATFQHFSVKRKHGRSHKQPLYADPCPPLLALEGFPVQGGVSGNGLRADEGWHLWYLPQG